MVAGSFNRSAAKWRNFVSKDKNSTFPAETGRYHLYVAAACPWAHRTLMVRSLKGLEDVISVSVVHPTWRKTRPDDPNDGHSGWFFADPAGKLFHNSIGLGGPFQAQFPGCEPDPIHDFKFVRDIYAYAGDETGTRSVPILWDKKKDTIVNNESSEIIRMFNSEFDEFAKNPTLDLYPQDLRKSIDEVNDWIYPTLNNGVYRCGFSKSQEAYNIAIDELTSAFDRVDEILQKQKYIAGDELTEADIRLFSTLLRFDEVYVVYFKTNTRTVASTPSMLEYCRRIYNTPGIKETCDMHAIKFHYYTSHPNLNKWSIIPRGPDFESLLKRDENVKSRSNDHKRPKLSDKEIS